MGFGIYGAQSEAHSCNKKTNETCSELCDKLEKTTKWFGYMFQASNSIRIIAELVTCYNEDT